MCASLYWKASTTLRDFIVTSPWVLIHNRVSGFCQLSIALSIRRTRDTEIDTPDDLAQNNVEIAPAVAQLRQTRPLEGQPPRYLLRN
jgi:hypothetical protein